ncbi:CarD family transcriptional regulator [Alloiococcus sp. CFN-8]
MFSVGDLIIYSSHGLCRIDEICERLDLEEGKR